MNNQEVLADAVNCFASLKNSAVPEVAQLSRHLEKLCGVIVELQSGLESHEKRLNESALQLSGRSDRKEKRAPWAVR